MSLASIAPSEVVPTRRKLGGTLWLYQARLFLLSCGLFIGVLSGLLLLLAFVDELHGAASGTALTQVLWLAVLAVPALLESILPFIVFLAVIHFFISLHHHGEMTSLRSHGLSDRQILAPVLVATLLLGIATFVVLNPLAAASTLRKQQVAAGLQSNLFALHTSAWQAGFWLMQRDTLETPAQRIFIRAERASADGTTLEGVTVITVSEGQIAKHLSAREASLRDGSWLLKNVSSVPLGAQASALPELRLPSTVEPAALRRRDHAPETTSLWRLPALIEARHNLGSGTHPLTYRYHEILATPARLLVFALLASVFSLYPWRRNRRLQWFLFVAGSLLLLHGFSDLMRSLGLTRQVPVLAAIWGPLVICALLSVAALSRSERL